MLAHPLSHPSAPGICPEMLEVAEEATRAGDFSFAAEIYSSQLADLQQPDRGLCLRKADSLVRAGRISEALDSYCSAASLGKLRPEELPLLVESIARGLREKEPGLRSAAGGEEDEDAECGSVENHRLDLFSCGLCRCLLHEPSTVECGHTFCRRCLEPDTVTDCVHCKRALGRKNGLPNGRRLDVVLGGLLDKLFPTESRARRLWIDGEVLRQSRNLTGALQKYDGAVELGKGQETFKCFILCNR